MDADHPITLVLCVVAMLLAIIVGARLFERWMRRRESGWFEVALFAAAALAFGAGAAFVPDVSPLMRVWIATAALLFAFGSLGTAFQSPGFRPPSQDEEEDDESENDQSDDKPGGDRDAPSIDG